MYILFSKPPEPPSFRHVPGVPHICPYLSGLPIHELIGIDILHEALDTASLVISNSRGGPS